jgi:plasmid stabilization system protein ParE
MNPSRGFRLHPLAGKDIVGIWNYIAEDNIFAAGRVREEILDSIRALVAFPHQGYSRPELTSHAHCASSPSANM